MRQQYIAQMSAEELIATFENSAFDCVKNPTATNFRTLEQLEKEIIKRLGGNYEKLLERF